MPNFSIAELARIIIPPGSRHRLMALLQGYFDASFTDPLRQRPGITAIGGYVGTEDDWKIVEQKWMAEKEHWKLREFSVAQILAGRTSVGQTQAEDCIRSFGKIINESDLVGISAAINDQDWESAIKSDRVLDVYHTCLSMLFRILTQHVELEFEGDAVAVVFDTDRAPSDALNAIVTEWMDEKPQIANVAFGRRSQYPLLECADLCAGTERKSQLAGGWFQKKDQTWFSFSHAKTHRGSIWSLEEQRRAEEALKRREEWKLARKLKFPSKD